MTRPSLALALALLASGCAHKSRAAQKTSQAQEAASKEEVVCFKERPTGTQIAQRVCYPKEQFDTQVAAAQDQFRRMLQAGSQNRIPAGAKPSAAPGK
jgi:hypothetical protein